MTALPTQVSGDVRTHVGAYIQFPATVINALHQEKLESLSGWKILGLKVIKGREKDEGDITHLTETKLNLLNSLGSLDTKQWGFG